MKKIVIVQGNEFKVYDNDIQWDEDIFREIYEKAQKQQRQIEDYTSRLMNRESKREVAEYLNNVIAFCGERGQGKSTAMRRFSKELLQDKSKEVLKVIDPAAMEMEHDIVDIIVSRLFDDFRGMRDDISKDRDIELIQIFERVHRDISVLKNAKKFIERDYAYNSSIQNLSDITDSMKMQEDIIKLVQLYLKYVKGGKEFLVICIDDLDLNLDHAYKVMEQLRKYFMIPQVMIIIAINITQLTLCVERELAEKLLSLNGLDDWSAKKEVRNMSNRYMEKLIPFSRRMQLPDIYALAEDGENIVEIIYKDRDGKEIFDSEELGIQLGILKLISEKTGIIYVAKDNEIHPIVPVTLRELVNLISFLGDLGDDQKVNLEIFEQYFYNIWVENNLSSQYSAVVHEIGRTQINALQKDAFLYLYEDLEAGNLADKIEKNLSGKPIRTGSITNELSIALIEAYENIKGDERHPDNGDIINCLRILERGNKSEVSRLVMAINTIFSIRMLKLKASSNKDILYDFIGGNLWGTYRLMREEAGRKKSRVKFEYSVKDFIEAYNSIVIENFSVSEIKKILSPDKLVETLFFIGMFSNFKNERGTNRELVSGNNTIATKAEFDINQFFVAGISISKIAEKVSADKWGMKKEFEVFKPKEIVAWDVWSQIVCNMEAVINLAQYAEIHREIKDAAEEADYYICFFENVNTFLKKISEYIPSVHPIEDKMSDIEDISRNVEKMRREVETQQAGIEKYEAPSMCKADSKGLKLKDRLEELKIYMYTQNREEKYKDYDELLRELQQLTSKIMYMEDQNIGKELAGQYNELRRKIIR